MLNQDGGGHQFISEHHEDVRVSDTYEENDLQLRDAIVFEPGTLEIVPLLIRRVLDFRRLQGSVERCEHALQLIRGNECRGRDEHEGGERAAEHASPGFTVFSKTLLCKRLG